jgi:hypothetical protein
MERLGNCCSRVISVERLDNCKSRVIVKIWEYVYTKLAAQQQADI